MLYYLGTKGQVKLELSLARDTSSISIDLKLALLCSCTTV